MEFGTILRALLEEKGISQKQMAADLNISASTLGNYIRNLRQPDFKTVCKIADYFSVSTDFLLSHTTKGISTQAENELLQIFRSLNEEQQDIYIKQGKVFLNCKTKTTVQLN